MKKIGIRTWFAMQTSIVVGLVVLNMRFGILESLDWGILYILSILCIMITGVIEKRREIIDEFSVAALNKANQAALKVTLTLLLFTLIYAQSMEGREDVISLMIGGIIAVAFIVKLVVFISIDTAGIDYDDNPN